MLISCWSAKGGSGTTVVSVALALSLAARSATGALLVDGAGDAPAVLGAPEPVTPGLLDWLGDAHRPDGAALARLELAGPHGLAYIPLGSARSPAPPCAGRIDEVAALLASDSRPVVVDCGVVADADARWLKLAAAATVSLLVVRPCYLALRRAVIAPLRPSGVIVVHEPGRALGRSDIEDALGVSVKATVELDPAVARAVDAGLFATRIPRSLQRALRAAA